MIRYPIVLLALFMSYLVFTAIMTCALADPRQRVVIAGGDLTEIAFALGAGDRIVGVDSTSTFPDSAAEQPKIGYFRHLSAEGVLSLAPDLVITAHDAGPDAVLSQIAATGTVVARAPQTVRIDQIADKIRFVGQQLGMTRDAETLAMKLDRDLAEVAGKIAGLADRPRVLFILSLERGTPMVAGTGTSAHEMITQAGGQNAAAGFEGFKPMAREALIEAAPDVILLMDQHAQRFGGVDAVLDRPEIALTPAGQARRAIAIEGMLLLGFGPRTPEALAMLARALHPGAAGRAGL